MIDYNECNYSPGKDKHTLCTHPHYCIFNKKRIQLEKNIHELEKELHDKIHSLNFIKKEGTDNSENPDEIENRIKILNEDLNKLKKFRNKMIKKGERK